jgi:hypothetical protein
MKTMRVQSADDALNLFLGSSRSNNDITKYLSVVEKTKEPFKMYIIIREYFELHPSMVRSTFLPIVHEFGLPCADESIRVAHQEFRGFAYGKKLNAVCQYYTACFFPSIVENKAAIQKRIRKYFKRIRKLIPMPNFVVDFVVMDDSIKIIELNPWVRQL